MLRSVLRAASSKSLPILGLGARSFSTPAVADLEDLFKKIKDGFPGYKGASPSTMNTQERRKVLSMLQEAEEKYAKAQTEPGAYRKAPVRVAVTGAAGAIGYQLVFRIASGQLLGPDQPVILSLIELPNSMKSLGGVKMELDDCAFPLLRGVEMTDNVEAGFENVKFALLVGAKPRGPGMERKDLLRDNGAIFKVQGQALSKTAHKDVKVMVVGNPANTNCLIAATNAKNLRPEQFSALMRLDVDRATAAIALQTDCTVEDIERLVVWGNHSSTQYPDVSHLLIEGNSGMDYLETDWVKDTLVPLVQKRGAAIIEARGASSAASAANAAISGMRDWALGCYGWNSMAVRSAGEYGVAKDVYYSMPVLCRFGHYHVIEDLPIDSYSAEMMQKTGTELLQERDNVADLL